MQARAVGLGHVGREKLPIVAPLPPEDACAQEWVIPASFPQICSVAV